MEPILEAIKNGDQDVSGFKFSPKPNIDFGSSGPFALMQGVAIANYPTITITVKSSDYKSIATTMQETTKLTLSFLGIPLGSATESQYQHHVTTDESHGSVTITLSPPPNLVAGTSLDSQGWILGVQTDYPAA